VLLTALLQPGESTATFFCKQPSASLPPGATPEHRDMKSDRQADFIAFCWAAVSLGATAAGLAAAADFTAGLLAALGWAGGGGAATAGAGGGAGAMVAWAGAGAAACAGAAGAAGAAAAGAGAGASDLGFGSVWLTAALQAGDRLLTFFCRQASAS
jgi:hypothetical protein